jgi:hypothetical protein
MGSNNVELCKDSCAMQRLVNCSESTSWGVSKFLVETVPESWIDKNVL